MGLYTHRETHVDRLHSKPFTITLEISHTQLREKNKLRGSYIIWPTSSSYIHTFRTVVLNQRWLCPPGYIWQCLGTFLIVMTRVTDTDIQWVEARDKHSIMNTWGQLPWQIIKQSKISIVARLRNLGLEDVQHLTPKSARTFQVSFHCTTFLSPN